MNFKKLLQKNSTKLLISLAITATLAGVIFQHLDLKKLADTLRQIHLKPLLFSICAFLIYQYIRKCRFQLLITPRCNNLHLFNTQCLHSALRNILPIGLGEAAFTYLMKKFYHVSYHEGTAALIIAKIVDLIIFAFLAVIAVIIFSTNLQKNVILALGSVSLLVLVLIIGIATLLVLEKNISASKNDFKQSFFIRNLCLFGSSIRAVIKRGIGFRLASYSALMVLLMCLCYGLLVYAMGFNIPWHVLVAVYLFVYTINLLPVKGIANIGTFEATWFVVLKNFNIPSPEAAIIGFGAHILLFIVIFASLAFSYALLILSGKLKTPLKVN
jgi:uncharacterized protein (TIRG00374 family)